MKKFSPTWLAQRQTLTQAMRSELEFRLGKSDAQLVKYEQEFQKEFSSSWKVADFEALAASMLQSQVLLVGDFHCFKESQKIAKRILKKLKFGSGLIYLYLECFQINHQNFLNQYQNGEITCADLFDLTQWEKRWPFSREGYQELLELAKAKGFKLIGLHHGAKRKSLKHRDQAMANFIGEAAKSQPQAFHIVHVGEWHCSPGHLPDLLKPLKQTVFIQSPDDAYFSAFAEGAYDSMSVLQNAEVAHAFAALSAPPWVRLHSYLQWIIGSGEDIDFEESEQLEVHAESLLRLLSADLHLPEVNAPSVRMTDEGLDEDLFKQSYHQISFLQNKPIYDPLRKRIIVSQPTLNQLSFSLGLHYLSEAGAYKETFEVHQNSFRQMVWLQAIGSFFAKWVNPAKKVRTLIDMEREISLATDEDLAQALKFCLIYKARKGSQTLTPVTLKQLWLAAKYLGSLMGEQLYFGFRMGEVDSEIFSEILQFDMHSEGFADYFDAIESSLGLIPLPYESKEDRL